jgi:steroid delta-isomerase-like uncharacterized protein
MSEQNKKVARRVFEEVQSRGDFALVSELYAGDFVSFSPFGEAHGPEGEKRFVTILRQVFPDLVVTVEDQVAEGDRVATRWTALGTHQGEFQGIPPTGRQMAITGISIFRIADSKILEAWGNPDMLGMLMQLGFVPALGQAGKAGTTNQINLKHVMV